MSAYRASKKNKVIYILFIIVLTIIALIGVFCYQLSLHIDEMSQCESKMLATEIINQAAKEALKTTGADDLIKEKLDEKGNVVSLSLDAAATNRINTLVSEAVTNRLKIAEDEGFKVPIGTLSGITFLNGRGFDLELKLHQLGSVSTRIVSEFESCGINQSKYKVILEIQVELSAVLPVKTTDISVDFQYLIGERIIVGKVPDNYFSV
ncbi:MAG: sporulation protein YunB [Ruminococcus sp.]|jgi:sporulation protein YunB|nr:sporulation protein YunB [Ruminococcus sp.]